MPPDSPTPGPAAWGWTVQVRCLLAGLTLASALALLAGSRPTGPPHAAAPLRIDPNTAPPEVLMTLPRVGPALAAAIVAARQARPFASLDDLDARVRGVGPATRGLLEPHLWFDAP